MEVVDRVAVVWVAEVAPILVVVGGMVEERVAEGAVGMRVVVKSVVGVVR